MWVDDGRAGDYKYTEEQLNSYMESAEFLDWALSVDVDVSTFDRIMEVRSVLPKQSAA